MKAIVLAAGKGKRLHSELSDLPKVMRSANGKPLLEYALNAIGFIPNEDICIVVGYKKEKVMERFTQGFQFAEQAEKLGTGHAVRMAKPLFEGYQGNVLITYGDMPLLKRETFEQMCSQHEKSGAACTLMSAVVQTPPAYGRLVRDQHGKLLKIVETKDCNEEQLKIKEVNIGVYVFDSQKLFQYLERLKNNNVQNEYYLTDVPEMMMADGLKVDTFTITDESQVWGVNTQEELDRCEAILKSRQ